MGALSKYSNGGNPNGGSLNGPGGGGNGDPGVAGTDPNFPQPGETQSQIAARADANNKAQVDNLDAKLKAAGNPLGLHAVPHPTSYTSPGSTDVGGYVGGAYDQQQRYLAGQKNNDAEQAANLGAEKAALGNMTGDRGMVAGENATLVGREAAARGQQGQALDLARQAAMGQAPSAAAFQGQMDMNNIMSGQAGAAGAARGLAGLNGVQGAGAAGVGIAGSQAGLASGMGRSKEMGEALGLYGTSAMGMGSQDLARQKQNDTNALGNVSLNDAWTEGNANLAANQGKLGLAQGQMDDAWWQQSMDPMKRQMSYDSRMNAIQAGANADSADAVGAKMRADADRARALAGGAAQAGLTAVGSLAGPAGTAAGAAGGGMLNSYINRRT